MDDERLRRIESYALIGLILLGINAAANILAAVLMLSVVL